MRISDWSSDVCSSDLVIALIEPGVELDEDKLALAFPPVTPSERRLGQLDHRGLAHAPSSGNANRDRSSSGLNDYLCHGVCHTGAMQELARSLIVGIHKRIVSSTEIYLEAFPSHNNQPTNTIIK